MTYLEFVDSWYPKGFPNPVLGSYSYNCYVWWRDRAIECDRGNWVNAPIFATNLSEQLSGGGITKDCYNAFYKVFVLRQEPTAGFPWLTVGLVGAGVGLIAILKKRKG